MPRVEASRFMVRIHPEPIPGSTLRFVSRLVSPHPGPLPWGEGGPLDAVLPKGTPRLLERWTTLPPLPKGEGRGEGKRIRFISTASRTLRLSLIAFIFLALGLSTSQADHIVIGCIGDYGRAGKFEADVARLVKSWQPNLIITVGDNNYPSGAVETIDLNIGQFYHEFIAPYSGAFGAGAVSNRFFPSLGNHEWLTPGAQPHLDYFTLPGNERYYTFGYGPVQFFCLDSDAKEPDGNTADSRQGQWLQKELAASTSAWHIVYFHHAPYSSGIYHGSQTHESDGLRWPFKDWGAHVVLSGHDHLYEHLRAEGLTYFVNGLGGDSYDKFHRPPAPESLKRFSGAFGAMRIDATETNMTFRFITSSGHSVDTHVIFKRSAVVGANRLGTSFEVVGD